MASNSSGEEDLATERRPLSVDPATELSMGSLPPDLSKSVPAGIDPLVIPLIDQLEDPKGTHMPVIRASSAAFGGDPEIAQAAAEIAGSLAQVTRESEPSALSRLETDFDLTMALVLKELGPGWLARSRRRLQKKRKDLERGDRHRAAEPRMEPALVEAAMSEERMEEAFALSHRLADAKRAWVTAKRNEPAFRSGAMKRPPLDWKHFGPERDVPGEERVPISKTAPPEQAGVAPELRGFLDLVTAQYPGFSAVNRPEHGGGKFKGAGFSTDVYLTKGTVNENGFYDTSEVVAFLLALDRLAAANGVQWRALYNDEAVARALSGRTKSGFATFMGQAHLGKSEMLNYHGPAPLKLHLHIDFSVRMSLPPKV